MAITRSLFAVFAASVVTAGAVAAMISAGPAWADDPEGGTARAVGSGVLDGTMLGYTASGATIEEAQAAVIALCQNDGADQCTSDEATSGLLCIVSVGAGDGVIAGGSGHTVDEAVQDAYENASDFNLELEPGPQLLISSCP